MVWALGAATLTGCAIHTDAHYAALRPSLVRHDAQSALAYIDKTQDSFYGPKNQLMYLMDRAMVQFDAEDHLGCVATIEQAKLLAQKLWTRSIGKEAEAWLTTDNALPYQGEDFEKVFLHILAACSYLRVQALDDARVEVRQVTQMLRLLTQKYADEPGVYRDDALAHWLGGILYEVDAKDLAHLSDARIAYSQALGLYENVEVAHLGTPVPQQLVYALDRVLGALGPEGQTERTALRARYKWLPQAQKAPMGPKVVPARVVVLVLAGEAPLKAQATWDVVVGPNLYRVAYPYFRRRPTRALAPQMAVTTAKNGTQVYTLELGKDVQSLAIRNLSDHMARIKSRVLSREILKYTAGTVAEGVGLSQGGVVGLSTYLAGLALNTATAATAEADTRSWATLPGEIYVRDVAVTPGAVTVQIGHEAPRQIVLAPGESAFFVVRQLM